MPDKAFRAGSIGLEFELRNKNIFIFCVLRNGDIAMQSPNLANLCLGHVIVVLPCLR